MSDLPVHGKLQLGQVANGIPEGEKFSEKGIVQPQRRGEYALHRNGVVIFRFEEIVTMWEALWRWARVLGVEGPSFPALQRLGDFLQI